MYFAGFVGQGCEDFLRSIGCVFLSKFRRRKREFFCFLGTVVDYDIILDPRIKKMGAF